MVLSDQDIRRAIAAGQIRIDPAVDFDVQLGPCSVDLTLDNSFAAFEYSRLPYIDTRRPVDSQAIMREISVGESEPFVLQPGELVLAATRETLELADDLLARLEGRSSLARLGIIVHGTAGVFDPGFFAGKGGFKKRGRQVWWGYQDGLTPLSISPRQRLDDAVKTVSGLPFGGTDCALPMLYARAFDREVDTFVVYTDSETWAGDIHPVQALREYRQASGIDARLVVCGMVSNGFSIADPNDPGMLDVVGFDTATPQLISDFARGAL